MNELLPLEAMSRRETLTGLAASALPRSKTSRFHCNSCGRAIFTSDDLERRVTLWDLKEYRADAYVIRRAIDEGSLSRYDVSLHEGWYCCRFIMMRMVVDKFGTGDALLVYADSVTEVQEGQTPPRHSENKGQLKLSRRDFQSVTQAADSDQLRVVKFGAIWCPPCRLVDSVLTRIQSKGGLKDVRFFEVDIDEEQELGARWAVRSVPFLVFFYRGRQLELAGDRLPLVNGVWVGGATQAQIETLCAAALKQARSGATQVVL
jgi:thiol-disulfide isomerase/thioredoxin